MKTCLRQKHADAEVGVSLVPARSRILPKLDGDWICSISMQTRKEFVDVLFIMTELLAAVYHKLCKAKSDDNQWHVFPL